MSGQVDTTSRGSSSVSIIMLFILGASFFVLGVLTIWLYRLYIVTGEYGLFAYFSGMLATAVFLWLSALLASRLSKKKAVSTSPKVRAALIATLHDPDPRVRSAAAKGLAKVDLEESTEYLEHKDLDAALIATLHDPDPRVRSAAVEGLAKVDVEESTEHLEHKDLDAALIATLKQDPDPRVRSTAAEGLAKLDLEQSSYYHEHNKLEDILFAHD
jgi:HEAT repeat protein